MRELRCRPVVYLSGVILGFIILFGLTGQTLTPAWMFLILVMMGLVGVMRLVDGISFVLKGRERQGEVAEQLDPDRAWALQEARADLDRWLRTQNIPTNLETQNERDMAEHKRLAAEVLHQARRTRDDVEREARIAEWRSAELARRAKMVALLAAREDQSGFDGEIDFPEVDVYSSTPAMPYGPIIYSPW